MGVDYDPNNGEFDPNHLKDSVSKATWSMLSMFLGFALAHLVSRTYVIFIWDMGNYVLRSTSEDFFKKTNTATDVQTWTMLFEHVSRQGLSRKLMFGHE